ncbi:MAG: hypothetical protein HQK55_01345 [Deltaproteobacteria bacterium]|nr:hypothetical protein [Deltaproteobacteria bacterium]
MVITRPLAKGQVSFPRSGARRDEKSPGQKTILENDGNFSLRFEMIVWGCFSILHPAEARRVEYSKKSACLNYLDERSSQGRQALSGSMNINTEERPRVAGLSVNKRL